MGIRRGSPASTSKGRVKLHDDLQQDLWGPENLVLPAGSALLSQVADVWKWFTDCLVTWELTYVLRFQDKNMDFLLFSICFTVYVLFNWKNNTLHFSCLQVVTVCFNWCLSPDLATHSPPHLSENRCAKTCFPVFHTELLQRKVALMKMLWWWLYHGGTRPHWWMYIKSRCLSDVRLSGSRYTSASER